MTSVLDIEKIKQGNVDSFRHLFEAFYPKMMALACRFVDEHVAKDMVQESFVSFWEQRETMDIRNIQSYLYRSVQNNCLNYIKHDKVVSDYENRVRIAEARIRFLNETSDENEILKDLEYKNIRSLIETSLNKLPPKCREAFRLCYFDELSYKEVAEIMNISHRTVEIHVQKALAFLKKDLKNPIILLLLSSVVNTA